MASSRWQLVGTVGTPARREEGLQELEAELWAEPEFPVALEREGYAPVLLSETTSSHDRGPDHNLVDSLCRRGAQLSAVAALTWWSRRPRAAAVGGLLVALLPGAALLSSRCGAPVSPAVQGGLWPPLQEKDAEARRKGGLECLDQASLNDFSSKASMEAAGWHFSWADSFAFKPSQSLFGSRLHQSSYWGFNSKGHGRLSVVLQGRGTLKVDFGNSWGDKDAKVTVLLNDKEVASAGARDVSVKALTDFAEGDTLTLAEAPTGVIVINHIWVYCHEATTTREPAPPPGADDGGLLSAEVRAARTPESVKPVDGLADQISNADQQHGLVSRTMLRASAIVGEEEPGEEKEADGGEGASGGENRSGEPSTTSLAPQVLEFCDKQAPVPSPGGRRAFDIPAEWKERCWNMSDTPPDSEVYPDRNWCWAWVKTQGCYWTHGHWSWWEAQVRIAHEGHAPDPHEAPFKPLLNASLCERPLLGEAPQRTEEELEEARQWVAEHVAIYVLNLPSDVERWYNMRHHLKLLGLQAKRVVGVDLAIEGTLDSSRREGLVPEEFDFEDAQRVAAEAMGGIVGTVGTAAAHFRALQEAETASLEEKAKPLALILEDDSELVSDFTVRLKHLMSEAPCDWQAISLKSRCPYGECATPHLTRVRPDGNEPKERCHHGVNYGFYAMLYRTSSLPTIRQVLRQTVWQKGMPRCLDIDVALASMSDKIPYYAVPGVQVPGFLHEGHQGSARYTKNKLALPQR